MSSEVFHVAGVEVRGSRSDGAFLRAADVTAARKRAEATGVNLPHLPSSLPILEIEGVLPALDPECIEHAAGIVGSTRRTLA